MKMQPREYTELQTAIRAALETLPINGCGECHDAWERLPIQRKRWDLLWLTQNQGRLPSDWFQRAYAYMDDTHIETALKRIVPNVAA